MTTQDCSTRKGRQVETPGERGDRLGAEGYTLQRTDTLGTYLLTKPDRTRTYKVDAANYTCNCQATTQWCKHQIYCRWFYVYDRAVTDLAAARKRGVLVDECQIEVWAADACLASIVGRGGDVAAERRAA